MATVTAQLSSEHELVNSFLDENRHESKEISQEIVYMF
jgi:hypothetical protein